MADAPPTIDQTALQSASDLEIWNGKGEKVRFGSVFEQQKAVVVFIRHFFCGNCQQYVAQIAQVPQDALKNASVNVAVVGCGEWKLIQNYKDMTGFQGEIYADPERKLYRALGMTTENLQGTPAGEKKRSYLTDGFVKNVLSSMWRGPLKSPQHIGKQGNISQLGGEFVFGPGVSCSFVNRMKHTEDHVEIPNLMKLAGVELP